ncbi:LysR family transcriptional regulator [Pseudomonas sp. DTU_2021_1001937_2_SI_NGA_ILE_001]|uniref:LysR family transcriptional regulator n=1 Tax=Pseudomonas sp. DTU_2021_1001937_2_SI_NGA_ILE_001 TaxID=3077589 RepID=UPI0025DE9CF0|nr:LysR family transcriptional regulator [Pseudomonas sp. DTU_2021_1001937_2_SI_NGA_ILE_001]WNW09708.1 LysR family transcriptional regulator [Pseudomonas sp. DTU_2021_1001937_2_SI_NGA_ILE_001]
MKNALQHIRAFLAVVHRGNFARAADDLHLSPSALTVQIRQLEGWLGISLLERSPRHVELTAAGREALPAMEKLLLDFANIVNAGQGLAALRRGVVSVAALPSLCSSALPECLAVFRGEFPGIEVRLRDVVADRICELVRDGDVDFGLGVRPRMVHGLDFQTLMQDRLCLFVPIGHPLADGTLTLADLDDQPMILTGRDSSVRVQIEQVFQLGGLALRPVLEANYMSTVLALVRNGLGIALLPESADDGDPRLVRRHLSEPGLARELGVITRQGYGLSPAALRLVECLEELSNAEPVPDKTRP